MISMVVAMDRNRAIGKDNKLIWHLPADLKHFKNITTGHAMIMGRKTFESIGKPLPNRTTIIVTHKEDYNPEGCIVAHSIDEAIKCARNDQEIMVIGGAEIFRQMMDRTDRIYLTIVHETFEADTFFPEIKKEQWKEVSREDHKADDKNPYDYSFITLDKVTSK